MEEFDLPYFGKTQSKHYAGQKAGIKPRQDKARAASKRARQARKLNRSK